jgi:DNA-binding CsgD family transcriptional regulator
MSGAIAMTANALTQKELEVLALIAKGHDAKSAAIELSISYHTIYERLRRARAKVGVTSSREAARIVFQSDTHQKLVGENLGLGDLQEPTATYSSSSVTASFWVDAAAVLDQSTLVRPSTSAVFGALPLRVLDEREVQLTKTQRLQLIFNLSAKLALTFAAICLAAMIASTIFGRG